MKTLSQLLHETHAALDAADIDHALIGGLALGNLGVHRATIDIDFLVPGELRAKAVRAIEGCGFSVKRETEEIIQFTGPIGLDLLMANRAPTRAMLQRALKAETLGVKSIVAEDLIGLKIQAYKNDRTRELQDKADIVSIMRVCRELDWTIVRSYATLFDEWPVIERLRQEHDL